MHTHTSVLGYKSQREDQCRGVGHESNEIKENLSFRVDIVRKKEGKSVGFRREIKERGRVSFFVVKERHAESLGRARKKKGLGLPLEATRELPWFVLEFSSACFIFF